MQRLLFLSDACLLLFSFVVFCFTKCEIFLWFLALQGFKIIWFWPSLMKVIPETRGVWKSRYLSFYFSFTLMYFRKGIYYFFYQMWNNFIVLWYFLLSTIFILFHFQIVWLSVSLMKAIPETRRCQGNRY